MEMVRITINRRFVLDFLAPMSGPNGRIGQEMSAAIQMGALEINASGGVADREIVVIACDSATPGEFEETQLKWLIDDAHVPFVIAPVMNANSEAILTRQTSDSRWIAIAPVYGPIQNEAAQRSGAFWVMEPSFGLQLNRLVDMSVDGSVALVGGRSDLHKTRTEATYGALCAVNNCDDNDIINLSMDTVTTPSIVDVLAQNSVNKVIFIGHSDELIELIREAASTEALLDLEIVASASAYDIEALTQLETMEEIRLRSQLRA